MKSPNIIEVGKNYYIDATNYATDFGDAIVFYFQNRTFCFDKKDKTYRRYYVRLISDLPELEKLTPQEKSKVETIKMMMVLDK